MMSGLDAIESTFLQARQARRATFMPFFTIGYPDLPTSLAVIEALVEAGADALELGVPFSDPLADGPTVQHASSVSLQHGMRVKDGMEVVRTLRQRGVTIPLVMMGYVNPILAYGMQSYARDAAQAGASGFIVPDLPTDEAAEMNQYCEDYGLSLTPLLAPTSTPDRIRYVTSKARGFVYLVSVTGITGARDTMPPDLSDYVRRVRSLTTLPLAVGFGISTPDHARIVAGLADGVVVGSALIRTMETEGLDAVKALAVKLRAACAATV